MEWDRDQNFSEARTACRHPRRSFHGGLADTGSRASYSFLSLSLSCSGHTTKPKVYVNLLNLSPFILVSQQGLDCEIRRRSGGWQRGFKWCKKWFDLLRTTNFWPFISERNWLGLHQLTYFFAKSWDNCFTLTGPLLGTALKALASLCQKLDKWKEKEVFSELEFFLLLYSVVCACKQNRGR